MKAFLLLTSLFFANSAYAFPVYFCKMKFYDNQIYEGKVSSDLCISARAVYDSCRGEALKIKNSDFICRVAVNERMECMDLTKNEELDGKNCSF